MSIIVGGARFKEAAVPLALMSLYPIHQTYGQLNSAVYFATVRTRLYRNIGISISLLGLLVTFLFLAPKEQLGLNLGSTGLALKMVLVQIIGQNLILWFNVKFLKISFLKMLGHQFISVFIIGTAAGLATLIANDIIEDVVLSVITAGIIYMVLLMGVLYWFPSLFSTNRSEIIQNVRLVKERLIG